MDKRVKAILLMAGRGERFKDALPKQFHPLSGKKIYLHTLERFLASQLFDEILLIPAAEYVETVTAEVKEYGGTVRVAAGGATRQASSYLGLLACGFSTDCVVIHDAVRPFVSLRILADNVAAVKTYGAVDTCIPSTDTLAYAPLGTTIEAIPRREHYLRGQTPQSFAYPLILRAHEEARGGHASDDCQVALASGAKIHVVQGEEHNIKITSPLDLVLAEHLFQVSAKSATRATVL